MEGKLIVISGFSGVGKGTVIHRLMEENEGFAFSISCTTRYRREGEVDGRDYFFLSQEAFEDGIERGRFLEYARYSGNYYGTPAQYVFNQMKKGIHIVLDIEYQGAFQVKEKYPDAVMLFLIPPSARVLVERLVNRGTETREQIRSRLAQALTEADQAEQYDGILVNDRLEQTLKEILRVVEDPKCAAEFRKQNAGLVQEIKKDLNGILKTW
ncbi:MAG: guanylate kinase [Lachnospiraceae bacterium]|nr:guanylate kinase [Lachnospiraceae bacterium]